MWSPLTRPDGDEMTALANQFSQENAQGIKVTHTAQPDYLQKLNTAAAGNSLPEMTVIRAGDIGEMVARNVLKPMSDAALTEAGGADMLKGQFTEAVWNAGQVKDARYTIPLDTHPLVLYYNKDMFQKAGITMPTDRPMTKEEFEKAVDALNKDGIAGVSIGTAFQTGAWFQALIREFGGDITNADGTQATYNSDQGVQAATYIHDLKAKTTPQVNGAGDPEVKLFQQQKAAMVFHGPWHISDMVKLPFVGFAQMPQIGSTYSVWGNSHQLAMTTEDPAKQAAAGCWIGWLSQNSVQWAKAGQVPARKSARESGDLAQVAPAVAAFAKEIEAVEFLPPVPGLESALWAQGFEPPLNDYLLGKSQDIKAGLDQAAAKSDQIIKDNAAKYE
jgi:multiple sugar transport system substrate-binding protein